MRARAILGLLAGILLSGCATNQDPNSLLRRQVVMSCTDGTVPMGISTAYGRPSLQVPTEVHGRIFSYCLRDAEKLVP